MGTHMLIAVLHYSRIIGISIANVPNQIERNVRKYYFVQNVHLLALFDVS